MDSGVYEILNTINGKRYIGSSKELTIREKTHWNSLKQGNHPNQYLQFAVNKYGLENFEFNVLEYCAKEYTLILEQWYLDNAERHYNLKGTAKGGCGNRLDSRFFDEDQVRDIVELVLAGFTQYEIAEYYDCKVMTINNIVKRNTYKDIIFTHEEVVELDSYLKSRKHGRVFSCEDVVEIKQSRQNKQFNQKQLAEIYGVSETVIHEIVKNKSYQHCN